MLQWDCLRRFQETNGFPPSLGGIAFMPMLVKRIIDGTKTETRRVVKPQPIQDVGSFHQPKRGNWDYDPHRKKQPFYYTSPSGKQYPDNFVICTKYDHNFLWVREKIWHYGHYEGRTWVPDNSRPPHYAEDLGQIPRSWVGYHPKPAMFMPFAATSVMLEVKSISLEPLHSITEDQAKAEGVESREHFISLWKGIHELQYGWAANPWVWRITFGVAEVHSVERT